MKLLDNLTHVTQADHRPARLTLTLAVAGVIFLLALAIGLAVGSKLVFFALWAVGSLFVALAVAQTKWARRFVEWGHPKTEESRRRQIATCYVLAALAAVMLIYSLLQL